MHDNSEYIYIVPTNLYAIIRPPGYLVKLIFITSTNLFLRK